MIFVVCELSKNMYILEGYYMAINSITYPSLVICLTLLFHLHRHISTKT